MDRQQPRTHLGLPLWAVFGLAALALPGMLVHDLGIALGLWGETVLTVGPPAVWVVVAVRARVPSPVSTLVAVGALYGAALGIVHNLFWDAIVGSGSARWGWASQDGLAEGGQEILLRIAMTMSSLFTGLVVGLIAGLLAAAIRRT